MARSALAAAARLRRRHRPGRAVSGARLFISDAGNTAAALARDLGCAQQQLAAVHGRPAAEQAEEGEA